MSERPTYTLYLATALDDKDEYEPRAYYVYSLFDPEVKERVRRERPLGHPVRTRVEDVNYCGALDSFRHLPSGAKLRIMSVEQYLYGAGKDPGIFNTTPLERINRGYLRLTIADGLLKNDVQLREIDAVLLSRDIAIAAERSTATLDIERHKPVRDRAKRLLKLDPSVAPWDQDC